MAEMRVAFTLSDGDLKHLKGILKAASAAATVESEEAIVAAAEKMAKEVHAARPPKYIEERVAKLEGLIGMLKDVSWKMPSSVRRRVLSGLAYFTDPHDLIPDGIPGLGFLDDAIMIELVVQELQHEIEGYEDFLRYRHSEWEKPWHSQGPGTRDRKVAERQRQLRARIKQRETRDAKRAREGGRRFRLF
jgi:uncharacterized membrane protein YkvA (DUF1232 family)